MEAAINTLVSQFKAFAGKEGSSHTLSKDELQNLLTSQLPNYAKVLSLEPWLKDFHVSSARGGLNLNQLGGLFAKTQTQPGQGCLEQEYVQTI